MSSQSARTIAVNQVGYPANAKKICVISGQGGAFRVVNLDTGAVAFQGAADRKRDDRISGVVTYSGDFSAVVESGRYRIEQDGGLASAPFVIADRPYPELHRGLLKAFYFFRCGMELTEEFAGPWKHAACHTAEGIVHGRPERRLDSSGGWHDAGDYGKYAGPGAKAVADLLLAFELYPTAFAAPVPLPETDGRTPDVLHECRYELEWLLKMQDPESGGVFHKLTTLQFPPLDTMPEDDLADLYFLPVSATATGCVSAVTAMAARVYRPYDPAFADRCLQAAERAWAWLRRNPDAPGFRNPADVGTGEYGDRQDIDERYWASAELFRTTGGEAYREAFRSYAQDPFFKYNLGWADMGGYGTIAYLLAGKGNADAALYDMLLQGLVEEARRLLRMGEADGYLISLQESDYKWGSNMLVMNNAMLLLIAEHFTGEPAFADSALEHVHYLMGRNVLDVSYVTGYGERSYRHPHHRPSVADDAADPVPGMVSGGPNRGLNDDFAKEHLQGKAPAQCFIDHQESYSTNEVTIYWNSPAVFAVSRWAKAES